jgi:hypothetical protein
MNMYVDEKSDSVIVLMKPSNKEGFALGGGGGGKDAA